MVHPVQLGRTTRMSYSRIDEVLDMPNLIEVQKNSYKWFLEEGLREVFRDFLPQDFWKPGARIPGLQAGDREPQVQC